MALITCPDCGKEVSDRAPSCPQCGAPLQIESKVVVYGYTQEYLINPGVKVFWQGTLVGTVKRGDVLSFDIDTDGEVEFKGSARKAKRQVHAGRVNKIKLSYNRLNGKLVPEMVDVVTPGV